VGREAEEKKMERWGRRIRRKKSCRMRNTTNDPPLPPLPLPLCLRIDESRPLIYRVLVDCLASGILTNESET
jgi:hypothetical protein